MRFVIELPVETPPGGGDEKDDFGAALPVPGKSILVVDDEPAVASLLAEALSRDGYKVDLAANGAVALDAGRARLRPDRERQRYAGAERSGAPSRGRAARAAADPAVRLRHRGDILNPRTRAFLARTGAPQLEKPFTIESVKRAVRRALLAQ